LFVAFIASNAFSQDKPSKEVYYEDRNIMFWNQCANNGDCEWVSCIIPVRFIIHLDRNGFVKNDNACPQGGNAIGEITGDVYHTTGNGGASFDSNPEASVSCSRNLLHFVGPVTQVKIIANGHFTINATGETTSVIDIVFEECK